MKMPNLPTDNLYKFISISGLIGLFISVLSSFYLEHITYLKLAEIESTQIVTEAIMNRLEETPRDSPDFIELQKKAEEMLLENMKIAQLALGVRKGELRLLAYRPWAISISLLISILGIALWYFKVQRLLDIELTNRAEISNK